MKIYLLLLGCALPWLLFACSDAEKCTRGELGCRCSQETTCAAGAECKAGTCVASDAPDTSTPDEVDSGPPKPVDCSVGSFKGACKELCRAVCETEDNLCVASSCGDDDCTDDGIAKENGLLKTCVAECRDDVACVQDLCRQEVKRECEDFWYPDPATGTRLPGCFNSDPRCVLDPDFGCSDTCGTQQDGVGGELVNNGRCEDGAEGSVMRACPRSTDCTDCGPRVCGKQGAKCANAGECCGFFSKAAYCVDIDRDPDVEDARCLTTCTTSQDCDDGYACIGITGKGISVCSP